MIVPSAPGGGTDSSVRIFAPRLSELLGQLVLVDNRAGASGNIGAEVVARAAPDGYTLLAAIASHTSNRESAAQHGSAAAPCRSVVCPTEVSGKVDRDNDAKLVLAGPKGKAKWCRHFCFLHDWKVAKCHNEVSHHVR